MPSQKDIECNCRKNTICQMEGKCMNKNIIYQALVTQKGSEKVDTYIGLTSTTFKARLANHQQAFKNKNLQTSCKLAQFIWSLKEKNIDYSIKWKLIARGAPYSITSNTCKLCTLEKYYILYKPTMATINKRSELVNNCRHKSKQLLDKG